MTNSATFQIGCDIISFVMNTNKGTNDLHAPVIDSQGDRLACVDYNLATPLGAFLYRESCFRGTDAWIVAVKTELLDIYLDTSGKESDVNDTVLAVTACMATPTQWNQFKDDWHNILKETPLPLSDVGTYDFHTTEFWAKTAKPYRDEDGWTQEMRDQVYKALIQTITKNTVHRTGLSLSLPDYRKLCTDFPITPKAIGQAGTVAMSQCFKQCAMFAEENGHPMSFTFISDWGDEFWGQIKAIFDNLAQNEEVRKKWGFRIAGLMCGQTKDYPPIQAADVMSWEFTKHIKQAEPRQVEDGYKTKPSFNALNADGSNFRYFAYDALQFNLNEELMATVLSRMSKPERTRFETDRTYARQIESYVHELMKDA